MAAGTVWGLDIGNSAIKAVKMNRKGDGCEIVDFDIVDIVHSDDDRDRAQRVSAALATLCQNKRFGADQVFVSLPGNMCLFKEFKLPPGSEKKAADLVQYEAKQQIPFQIEEVEWGYETFEAEEGQLGVELVVAKKEIIQEILRLTDSFKLNVRGISVAPLAIYNFIRYEFDPRQTVLVLDSGCRGTDFVAMSSRHVYFRTIPIGGREITRMLENKFKMTFEKAEKLKKELNQQKQSEKILGILEPTFRSIGAEIQRSIGYYKSRCRGARIEQVFLLGHTFRIPTMAEFLAGQVREAPFQIVAGLQKVQINPAININIFLNEFPTLAVAIGLGLQGLGLSEMKVNLVPAERKAEMELKSKRGWAVAAAAVLLATLLVSYHRASVRLQELEKLKEKLRETVNKVETAHKGLAEASKGIEETELKVRRWARMGRDRGKVTAILSRIADLRRGDGRRFFGLPDPNPNNPEQTMFLTGLYISRVPMTASQIGAVTPPPEAAVRTPPERRVGAEIWSGDPKANWAGYYQPLSAADLAGVPYELRPDLPLMVVLSGEIPGTDGRPVESLREALSKQPGFKEVQFAARNTVYREEIDEYSTNERGGPPEEKVTTAMAPPKRIRRPYVAFAITFRYEADDDPDIRPEAQPR